MNYRPAPGRNIHYEKYTSKVGGPLPGKALFPDIVFYTDGIVEAMNKKEGMYGFERLLDVVQASGYMDADSLLTEIISRVNTFAGGVDQHDDITVIVLSVAA